MVTTPRLPREPDGEEVKYGLREAGRIFWPEKSPDTLPPIKGEIKLVDKDALEAEVRVRFEFVARELVVEDSMRVVGKKCVAMVATSIAAEREKERERERGKCQ